VATVDVNVLIIGIPNWNVWNVMVEYL
jgi:hypothetical protein